LYWSEQPLAMSCDGEQGPELQLAGSTTFMLTTDRKLKV